MRAEHIARDLQSRLPAPPAVACVDKPRLTGAFHFSSRPNVLRCGLDVSINAVMGKHIDPAKLARKLDVLKGWEEVVE